MLFIKDCYNTTITQRHSMTTLPSSPISFQNRAWYNFSDFSGGWENILFSFWLILWLKGFVAATYWQGTIQGATPFGQNQKRQWPAALAGEARQCGWLGTRLLPAGAHNLQAGHSKNRSGGYVFMWAKNALNLLFASVFYFIYSS